MTRELIDKWHGETLSLLADKIGSDPVGWCEVDKLCVCGTKASGVYCDAIMQLLSSGHEWPAKALMRCLGELNAKFTWSLVGCRDDDNTSERITERINRWVKSAYSKGIELLEEFDSVVQAKDRVQHEKMLSELRKEAANLTVKNMPSLKQVFEQLGDTYYDEIRPVLYCRFNTAVHIDPSTLAALWKSLTEEGSTPTAYCAAYAFNINSLTRLRYELDTGQIKQEYDQLVAT